jgi:hypothetical protein
MSGQPGQTYRQFRDATTAAVRRFRAMSEKEFVTACSVLAAGDDVDPDHEQLGDIMVKRARQGSIDACAALIVMGAGKRRIAAAFRGIVDRSADLQADAQFEALVYLLEQHCEKEVAAGRMARVIDPKTGQTLYRTVRNGRT